MQDMRVAVTLTAHLRAMKQPLTLDPIVHTTCVGTISLGCGTHATTVQYSMLCLVTMSSLHLALHARRALGVLC